MTSFRNLESSLIMTRNRYAELIFTFIDDEDDVIFGTMHGITFNEEMYIDDVTLYCIWELRKVEKQRNLESNESLNLIMSACRTHCSRCRVKKKNYDFTCTKK